MSDLPFEQRKGQRRTKPDGNYLGYRRRLGTERRSTVNRGAPPEDAEHRRNDNKMFPYTDAPSVWVQRSEYERLREALERVLVGGNHLALLIGNHPPYTASHEIAQCHYLPHHKEMYEAWCCWRTIMEARAALQRSPAASVPPSPARPDATETKQSGEHHYAIAPKLEAADAFWKYWRENGETHKHGYYESTWGAINAALRLVGVVEHHYAEGQASLRAVPEKEGADHKPPSSVPSAPLCSPAVPVGSQQNANPCAQSQPQSGGHPSTGTQEPPGATLNVPAPDTPALPVDCSSPEYIRERLTKNIKMSSLINLSRTSEQVIDGIIAALCGEGKL